MSALRLPGLVDDGACELINRLCTAAGMIMEDASAAAVRRAAVSKEAAAGELAHDGQAALI